jgi:hypothetical protein
MLIWLVIQQVTTQRLSLRRMWYFPIMIAGVTYINLKPDVLNNNVEVFGLLIAFVVGGLVGLGRGSLNQVEIDQMSGQIVVKGSLVGLLAWFGFLALEIIFRLILINSGANANGSTFGTVLPLTVLTGFFTGWRAMWYLKYLQLSSLIAYSR